MVELVKNMQACVTSFTSLTNTQRTGPRLTVTSALSGLIFFFFFRWSFLFALPFAFVYLWKHRGA